MLGNVSILTRTALLLAVTLIFQSLRFFIPIPVYASTFVIGSLVNACLLITVESAGLIPAVFLSVIAPTVAYFQQLLLLPIFIFPVALSNISYVGLYNAMLRWGKYKAACAAAISKTILLYFIFMWLLSWIQIPAKAAAGLMFVMSWPQLVTGFLGAALSGAVIKRLRGLQ